MRIVSILKFLSFWQVDSVASSSNAHYRHQNLYDQIARDHARLGR